MAKRILVIVPLLVLALFAYEGYRSYDAKRMIATGQVYSNGVIHSAARGSEPRSTEPDILVYPAPATNGLSTEDQQDQGTDTTSPTMQASSTPAGGSQVVRSQQSAALNPPATDTISPNPPNGMTFSGSGRYQLYRQGNLTWRLDTETGRSCVIFATDEEWRKPRVYRAGCGKS
jgi:hypothetical protein